MISAWVKWDYLTPPPDVQGIFIRFENGEIWSDKHYYGSEEYRKKICGDSKPIEWTFMERTDPTKKSVQCSDI